MSSCCVKLKSRIKTVGPTCQPQCVSQQTSRPIVEIICRCYSTNERFALIRLAVDERTLNCSYRLQQQDEMADNGMRPSLSSQTSVVVAQFLSTSVMTVLLFTSAPSARSQGRL